jgi:histone H3/H4
MAKKEKIDPLYVKSKVREFIKSKGCNTSSGVLDGDTLNGIIIELLDKAINRAKLNNRKTVKARDL